MQSGTSTTHHTAMSLTNNRTLDILRKAEEGGCKSGKHLRDRVLKLQTGFSRSAGRPTFVLVVEESS